MRQEKIHPDAHAFESLMLAFSQRGQLEQVQQILELREQAGFGNKSQMEFQFFSQAYLG